MKRNIIAFVGICLSSWVFADGKVTFFNNSLKHDMIVRYEYCSVHPVDLTVDCTGYEEVTIPRRLGEKMGFRKTDMFPGGDKVRDFVQVVSVVEQDKNTGKVIVQGVVAGDGVNKICAAKAGQTLTLDDAVKNSFIFCNGKKLDWQ